LKRACRFRTGKFVGSALFSVDKSAAFASAGQKDSDVTDGLIRIPSTCAVMTELLFL
jgi:hypothetical protein